MESIIKYKMTPVDMVVAMDIYKAYELYPEDHSMGFWELCADLNGILSKEDIMDSLGNMMQLGVVEYIHNLKYRITSGYVETFGWLFDAIQYRC